MIQSFWFIDFIGLFLGRFILSIFVFKDFLRLKNNWRYLYLILSVNILMGYYSSFIFIFLIFHEIFFIAYYYFYKGEKFLNLEFRALRLSLAIVYLFVGPGLLSVDYFFNIRF